jgi:predicted metal-dependent peptidase
VSECVGILSTLNCNFLRIYFHDVNCYHIEDYTIDTIKKIKATRGGTSHVDVFEQALDREDNIGMIIAFTDLYTCFPEEEPSCPVVWAYPDVPESPEVPWGSKVKVKLT